MITLIETKTWPRPENAETRPRPLDIYHYHLPLYIYIYTHTHNFPLISINKIQANAEELKSIQPSLILSFLRNVMMSGNTRVFSVFVFVCLYLSLP